MLVDDAPTIGTVTPDDFRRIREVFELALLRLPPERREFVERACQGNLMLVVEVERMLAAEDDDHRLLDQGPQEKPGDPPRAGRAICPSCRMRLEHSPRFCPSCGTPVGGAIAEEGRFRAGSLFANRFRIVAMLGRGGMGEVYRAHDLELGQPVALKFLTVFRSDERARARLRTEVRLARQIAHPNVCRVYDIGEANGELYMSMEFVDGEDLSALLKRIGRLPIDKGVEIARKLCAGLAAAHAKSVLHRDLKPGNIMIDGHGEVRIMDFGLAAVGDQLETAEVRSGTPAYMAPEQLAGREATQQSDLYALGLVLYELFTGRPAFEARDIQELLRLREAHPVATPSTLIPDLDHRIERAILRCLEPDPQLRPASALTLSASLPGGDPLAEALAAGETPSPEMIAAAGPTEGLQPRVALSLVAGVVVSLTTVLMLTPRTTVLGKVPLKVPPEELSIRARDIARHLGSTDVPTDVVAGFDYDTGYLERAAQAIDESDGDRRQQWNRRLAAAPWPIWFTYVQSPARLTRQQNVFLAALPADGSMLEPGRITTKLDLDGRLLSVERTPTSADLARPAAVEPDWTMLFTAAGLDITRFSRSNAEARLEIADNRLAWTGPYLDANETPIRIEASSFHGAVSSFAVVFPWKVTSRFTVGSAGSFFYLLFVVGLGMVGLLHLKQGRGDTRSAWRFGLYAFSVVAVALLFVPAPELSLNIYSPVGAGAIAALMYLAIEPWTRRLWPHAMITWARLLAGRWRDPVVGRDLLVTIACVASNYALQRVVEFAAIRAGATPHSVSRPEHFGILVDSLADSRVMAANLVLPFLYGLTVGMGLFLTLFIFNAMVRRTWIAAILTLLVWFGGNSGVFLHWMDTLQWGLEFGFLLFLTLHYGVFASGLFSCLSMLIDWSMFTSNFGAWYGRPSLAATLILGVLTVLAFRISIGNRPVLRSPTV
jgi:predicted Ser/Thr protein kinase